MTPDLSRLLPSISDDIRGRRSCKSDYPYSSHTSRSSTVVREACVSLTCQSRCSFRVLLIKTILSLVETSGGKIKRWRDQLQTNYIHHQTFYLTRYVHLLCSFQEQGIFRSDHISPPTQALIFLEFVRLKHLPISCLCTVRLPTFHFPLQRPPSSSIQNSPHRLVLESQKMAPATDQLTREEMWDDSALIESWNQALDEYKVRRRQQ